MKTTLLIGILVVVTAITALAHPGIGIVINAKGEIFYTDTERVWKISADGKSKTVVVPNVHTHELYMDAHDNLYGEHLWYEGESSDKWGHCVWKYDAKGKFSKVKPDAEGFLKKYSFVRDNAGNMYRLISSKNGSDWMKISPDQKVEWITTVPTKDVRWQFISKDGTFYYVDDNDLCKIVNKKAVLVTPDLDGVKGEDPKRKPNNSIFGMWDDPTGAMYVAVTDQKTVKKVTPDGLVSVVYQSPGTWMPTGGIVDKKGNFWVLEANAVNNVRVVKR